MTDGTSQGLFIVVAIVIFGIFVVLANTLFGSEGLTNDLKNIFTTSIYQTEDSFKEWEKVNIKIEAYNGGTVEYIDVTDNSVEFISEGQVKNGSGVYIPITYFEQDQEYKLTFEATKLEGSILNIGGHNHIAENITTYIDGKLQEGTFLYGIPYVDDLNTHTYEVYFDTYWLENINGALKGVNPKRPDYYYTPEVFISTNRTYLSDERKPHRVTFENITLEKRL